MIIINIYMYYFLNKFPLLLHNINTRVYLYSKKSFWNLYEIHVDDKKNKRERANWREEKKKIQRMNEVIQALLLFQNGKTKPYLIFEN